MNEKIVKIGLIGAGGRLQYVIKNLLKVGENRIRVGAAHDPAPAAVAAVREQFDKDVVVCASPEELVNRPDIEWVFVGSLNTLHAEQVVLALEAGKNVFCEKPLATSFEDCLRVKKAVEQSGKTFAFGLVMRYAPLYQKIHELVSGGAIGKIISFEFNETLDFNHGGYIFGNWRRSREVSGTHLLEKCCHDIDLANWIVGSIPTAVASFGGKNFFVPENECHIERIGKNAEGLPAYQTWNDPNRVNPFSEGATIVDNQVVIIEYANGVRATFHTNCNCGLRERRFYLCGTEGTLRADLYEGGGEIKRIGFETPVETFECGLKSGHGGGDQVMADNLRDVILHGASPAAGVEDGLHSCIAVFAMNEAMDEQKVVHLHDRWRQAGIVLEP